MLSLPEAPPIYRIMSIDQGTDLLGLAIFDVNLKEFTVSLVYVNTFNGTKNARAFPDIAEEFGDRYCRLQTLQDDISRLLYSARPNCVISEAPYLGKFAAAFSAGIECLCMIREVVANYDPSYCLELIDPTSVKKSIGLTGRIKKGGEKNVVRDRVLELDKLINCTGKDLSLLDPDSIDAIAVGCYKIKTISEFLL